MKLPSFSHLSNSFANGLRRFPLQILIAIVATIAWCWFIQLEHDYNLPDSDKMFKQNLLKAIVVINLALVLTLALAFFAERRKLSIVTTQLLNAAALAFCLLLYFVIDFYSFSDVLRVLFLSFAFHLLVSYAPFIGKGNMNGFWQFNKALFLRFLTSALYSGVLYLGLAAALGAVNVLFSTSFEEKTFLSLFAIIASGFNTIFFLSGLPGNYDVLDTESSYPKGLKVFTQYVLIPLMTIYLAILLVYESKIAILWQLPKGMVSLLILGYAVFGILSLLLVYPIKDTAGNSWIKMFSRFFYVMMIPLLVLLILAIFKRVGHYGITESRYVLIVLALWLSGITAYFIFSKKQNIKVIPVSLSIIALLAVYGPQSAFSVSRFSQVARLKQILNSTNEKEKNKAYGVVEYLVEEHGLESLQPFTKVDMKALDAKMDKYSDNRYSRSSYKMDTAIALLNVKHSFDYPIEADMQEAITLSLVNSNNDVLKVSGYDYVIEIGSYVEDIHALDSIKAQIFSKDENILLKVDGAEVMNIDLKSVFKEAQVSYSQGKLKVQHEDNYYYPIEKMTFNKTSGSYIFSIVLTSINGRISLTDENNDANSWVNARGYLLVKKM